MSNSGVDHVTRFPATYPSKAENFKTGINNSGLAILAGTAEDGPRPKRTSRRCVA